MCPSRPRRATHLQFFTSGSAPPVMRSPPFSPFSLISQPSSRPRVPAPLMLTPQFCPPWILRRRGGGKGGARGWQMLRRG